MDHDIDMDESGGWDASAQAWIADQGETGDWTRVHVLDRVMMERLARGGYRRALDIGCGEGRFCRMLNAEGVTAIGIDPTRGLIDEARARDPQGDYRIGRAEALSFDDGSFDLVVSYLSLIDIPDFRIALAEMVRVLAPGGALLIANLTSFSTASAMPGIGWERDEAGNRVRFSIDDYLDERAVLLEYRGIRIFNWHRPLSAYMSPLIGAGMRLSHFEEPHASGPDDERIAAYRRVPYAFVMEWRKDALPSG